MEENLFPEPDKNHIYHEIDPKDLARWNRKRWKRDDVHNLSNGFTLCTEGRQGTIYFRENENILEIVWELSGVSGIEIFLAGLNHWVFPKPVEVTPENKSEIHAKLIAWLKSNNIEAILKN